MTKDQSAHQLAGKTVIVTGAGSGIGRAIAIAFAQAGAHVLGVGRRRDPLDETAREHPGIAAFAADIRAEQAPEAIVDAAVDRWGRVDVLVNNAGGFAVMSLAEATASRVTDLFDLNVTAPTMLAQAALPHLRRAHGSIVNLSSTYGHRPQPGAAHYAASKSALEHLTRSWALELTDDRVRVNAVASGPVRTEVLTSAGLSDAVVEEMYEHEIGRIPLGRLGEPHEVAGWVLRLGDPTAPWLTGQVVTVDGGLELI
ncbi:SDR family NAD(P)-dependent oxidoreductase [Streptosporangium lutulentum]|uniref:NAD(P)-dependent dehydrogenase (Short-subunit alcohol dehydrogenase family) n=1 Tax=Streptosporangium lutulentum TaxID=1461250 RepID=A0ABT9QPN4_9ACTN|nr:SDR family oxidoreductase [Streptosporangium lutulentum]MDP9848727.1 NAD(P)-dependent dehydrogenase (short-subunit alcohol dehydrogenase family) [Streptosporangium lutulentum]